MKLTIDGTEEEIKNTLQAIGGSKERNQETIQLDSAVAEGSNVTEARAIGFKWTVW